MPRFTLTGALAVAAALLWSSPASADTTGSVATDQSGADASASTNVSQPRAGAGDPEQCEYRLLSEDQDIVVYDLDGSPISTDGTGQWYEKWCGTVFIGAIYISSSNPRDLLDEARRRIDLPLPQPQLSPDGEQLVNLSTWLWIDPDDWVTQEATAAVPGIAVTVTAVPVAAYWTMGDGSVVTCASPGTAFDPALPSSAQRTGCSHLYRRSSANQPGLAFAASVTTRWRLSWTVAGAAGGGDLGTIDRTTSFSVPVAEVQTVNANPRGTS